MSLGNINDVATFVGVVKAGSFTLAAKQMGVTRSAVGKGILRLEERLGVRLLNRTPRSLSLTDDGQVYFDRCRLILDDLEETETAMASRRGTPSGRIRLSLPIALGQKHVMPVLETFLKTWPEVSAEVGFTDRFVDLIDEGIDIAIRIGEPRQDSRLISRTVAQQYVLTCASPEYLQTRGIPKTPTDLNNHQCLFFLSSGRPQPWMFKSDKGPTAFSSATSRLLMDSGEALKAAVANGVGIANLPSYNIEDELRKKRLIPVLQDYQVAPEPIRVVYPTRQHLSPKVRAFIDALFETWFTPPWELER
ncbi:LysR family transcriptional regulator [Paraburkholderia sp. BL27I4N3]|nr:LysR family transcriptional regulator [Paraburkholderia sp. BL27I4N3]